MCKGETELTDRITSRENTKIKDLVKLISSKKARDEACLFVCEGVRLSVDAMGSGVQIVRVFFSDSAVERYADAVMSLKNYAEECFLIPDDLAWRVADTRTTQGVFAVCQKLDNCQTFAKIRKDGNYLLLSLQDPGNLGAILRTAEAFGLDGVIMDNECPDLYSPKVLRASMGGVFRLNLWITDNLPQAIESLQKAGIKVFAAVLREGATLLGDSVFAGGNAVLIGNEGNGLPEAIIRQCDGSMCIPMAGGAESLNAACAAAVFLWEITKRKRVQ